MADGGCPKHANSAVMNINDGSDLIPTLRRIRQPRGTHRIDSFPLLWRESAILITNIDRFAAQVEVKHRRAGMSERSDYRTREPARQK
jgi:hypothetical protein